MNAVLGLEDGTIIKGTGFGAEGIVSGELVFIEEDMKWLKVAIGATDRPFNVQRTASPRRTGSPSTAFTE